MSSQFFRRTLDLGPESPAVLVPQARAILDEKNWQFFLAYGFGGSLCGVMALFLIGVYFWRPVLVNRVSLRLIFAISIYDFIECVLQATARSNGVSAKCRATMFFSAFFGYASVYTSSSIALNLYLTLFRRGSRQYLPVYVEYLYFIVPLAVSLLHWAPPVIWAAKHGYCSAFEPVDIGTASYIRYVVFVQLLLPLLALLFNIITSFRIIIMLLLQQRQVNRSLQEVMQNTRKHVLCSNGGNGTSTYALAEDDGCGYNSVKATKELEVNLLVVRKFNNAAIRIALYPCAPIAWWCINLAFYAIQYSLTMTYKADVATFVRMVSLAWFSMPAIAFANFLVFVTDPALRKVIKEVHRSLVGSASSLPAQQGSCTTESKYSELYQATVHSTQSTLYKKGTGVHVSDAASSTDRSSFESDNRAPASPEQETGPSACSTAVRNTYNSLIRRHPTVGNSVDANLAYSKI